MSFDLLKEFGEIQDNPWESEQSNHPVPSLDDEFGEFERPNGEAGSDGQLPLATQQSLYAQVKLDTIISHDDEEQDFVDDPAVEIEEPDLDWDWQAPKSQEFDRGHREKTGAESVLFDAELEDRSQHVLPPRIKTEPKIEHPLVVEAEDEDFAAWDPVDVPEVSPAVKVLEPMAAQQRINQEAPATIVKPPEKGPPPINVPPPSLLLSLSNTILNRLGQSCKKPGSGTHVQAGTISPGETPSVLRAIGRVLAGRKSRWKRDNLLSQSMRIGQAGTQGGMKLTSVDKTESRREEQEAAELLKSWRQHAGTLRSELAQQGVKEIPELMTGMPVRAARPGEGALSAPKQCFLCGLKREERVLKLDYDVEDGFGLWWVEHWGHCDCVEFWENYKQELPQR